MFVPIIGRIKERIYTNYTMIMSLDNHIQVELISFVIFVNKN